VAGRSATGHWVRDRVVVWSGTTRSNSMTFPWPACKHSKELYEAAAELDERSDDPRQFFFVTIRG